MEDCLFCKIIREEVPSTKVYEDEDIVAFRDIHPVTPVHVLVIPKKHITSLAELNPEDEVIIGKIYTVIKNIANKESILNKGFRVIANCGEDGGQVIKHLHFHLLGGKKLGIKICN